MQALAATPGTQAATPGTQAATLRAQVHSQMGVFMLALVLVLLAIYLPAVLSAVRPAL